MAELVKARVLKGGWSWLGRTTHVGDPVEASAAQIAAWEEGGYVERVGALAPAPLAPETPEASEPEPPMEPTEDAPDDPAPEPKDGPVWPHKVSPERYLNRFPEGPDADVARSLLGKD